MYKIFLFFTTMTGSLASAEHLPNFWFKVGGKAATGIHYRLSKIADKADARGSYFSSATSRFYRDYGGNVLKAYRGKHDLEGFYLLRLGYEYADEVWQALPKEPRQDGLFYSGPITISCKGLRSKVCRFYKTEKHLPKSRDQFLWFVAQSGLASKLLKAQVDSGKSELTFTQLKIIRRQSSLSFTTPAKTIVDFPGREMYAYARQFLPRGEIFKRGVKYSGPLTAKCFKEDRYRDFCKVYPKIFR